MLLFVDLGEKVEIVERDFSEGCCKNLTYETDFLEYTVNAATSTFNSKIEQF